MVIMICLPLVMPLTLLCGFVLQEIVSYISQSLQEKKLLYFGMESLDFNFIDPVSIEPVVSYSYLHHKQDECMANIYVAKVWGKNANFIFAGILILTIFLFVCANIL